MEESMHLLEGNTRNGRRWSVKANGARHAGRLVLFGWPDDPETIKMDEVLADLGVQHEVTLGGPKAPGHRTPILVVQGEILDRHRNYRGLRGLERFVRRIDFEHERDGAEYVDLCRKQRLNQ
jgi:hypothetical protein